MLSQAIDKNLLTRLGTAWSQVTGRFAEPISTIIISGQGEFLIKRLLKRLRIDCTVISVTDTLGEMISRCAPAHALAVLAQQKISR